MKTMMRTMWMLLHLFMLLHAYAIDNKTINCTYLERVNNLHYININFSDKITKLSNITSYYKINNNKNNNNSYNILARSDFISINYYRYDITTSCKYYNETSVTRFLYNNIVRVKFNCGYITCAYNNCNNITYYQNNTVCRPSTGICDIEEVCDGKSLECPRNLYRSYDFLCHKRNASEDPCIIDSYCSGYSSKCQMLVFDDFDQVNPCGNIEIYPPHT